MPRVAVKKKEYKIKDLKGWIVMQMKLNSLRQIDVANALGVTQGRVSKMLAMPKRGESPSDPFSYGDLLTLCELFKVDGDEKQRLLTL